MLVVKKKQKKRTEAFGAEHRNWGEKEGHVSASILRLVNERKRERERAFQNDDAFFLSFFLWNDISLSFYCALFEGL